MPEKRPVFIMDNGAATIKAGFATDDKPHIVPNCKMKVKSERQRQYIGDQIDNCKDCSGLYYILPHQRGFIINWDVEREIWEYVLCRKSAGISPKDTDLVITEPYFNFKPTQNNTDEIFFEEYGFNAILRTNTGYLSSMQHLYENTDNDNATDLPTNEDSFPLACMVVDSGFSFTHIAPYVYHEKEHFKKLKSAVRRIDVGGKALTNHLKDLISYRQINVMDETYVINQCKEDVCFIAKDFDRYLKECEQKTKNKITRDYILPDFTNVKRGYVRKPEWNQSSTKMVANSTDPQFVRLANERFQVPEILFSPSDIGIDQVGIVEAIVDSINSLPKQFHSLLYGNIVLTGGNLMIPGFKDRVEQGLRKYCPSEYKLTVYLSTDPITHAWFGGKTLIQNYSDCHDQLFITKKEYEESGENKRQYCVDKFDT